ncbi:YggT family protein [Candidatus Saccharibacteria bacterium]|nr:YggT family protein [Candidatus Saccharibacteria bacterium]
MKLSVPGFNLKNWVGMWVNVFVVLVEILLLARVFFKFCFTAAGGSFFDWLNATTDTALAPLRGLFGSSAPAPGTNWYIDWVALFAMAAYPVVLYAAVSVALWLGRRK